MDTIQNFFHNKCIVITRTPEDNKPFKEKLESYGAVVYELPSITITGNTKDKFIINTVRNIFTYDWIIFTSAKGVDFFMQVYKSLGIDIAVLKKKKIAAVGSKTAEKIRAYNLQVDFIPTKYTTEQLAKELTGIEGKKILLARSDIASKEFIIELTKSGASITDIPIYKTEYLGKQDEIFEKLVKEKKIHFLTFTSPSTVKGFFERVKKADIKRKVLAIPIVSVGPVTTKTAQKYGFHKIFTADSYTTAGIIKKLQEISA